MNTTNQASFGFGSTAPSFGSAANTQSSAGTLFGGSAANNTQSTSNLFGSNANNSSAGTLFGTNTSNSSSAGTLFGGSAATNTPASSGFGGFGSTPATSSAFGANTSTNTGFGTTLTGGFGATSQPANSTIGGFGGFGSTPTSTANTTGFGTTTTTNTTNNFGSFGSAINSNKPAFGGFGTTNNLFGNKPQTGFGTQQNNTLGQAQTQQQQQMGTAPVQEKVWQELALIRARFDPTSPLCHFRHYFYNLVPANEIHLYVRPQNQDEQLWNEAVRKNPDPANLVPVLAVGFDDILKRMEIQSKQLELHQEKLKEAMERLSTVQRQYSLGTLVKLDEHKRRHTYLTQRLLRLLRYSQVLRYKGFPLTVDEEQSMNKLSQMTGQTDSPEQLNAKLVTLWNQLQAIKAQKIGEQNRKTEIWRTVNEEDTNIIAKVLEDEQKGIKHVTSILKSDTKELEDIETGLREKRKTNNDTYISKR
ncbi:MAG: nucleoporin complex subunit 54-domain-containing protein [Benjaminiella poitrasii]|nr:MAG: nucleoporin complex subunit 54-domain-containing protein [Benjaminiella poitrasii]